MSTGYKIQDQESAHYLTFQIVEWVDIFSRKVYRDIVIESLRYCQLHKGLEIYAFVVMSNHVHLLVRSSTGRLSDTIRDFKSYTAKQILQTVASERGMKYLAK
jgi:REP element-mobilizing transposase RayT